MTDNIIMKTDSYKVSHYKQYPKGTENVYSYIESRGGEFKTTVFFGLQYIIKKHLLKPIIMVDVDEAEKFWNAHLGPGVFHREGWEHIVLDHGGKLPLRIKAVPEGTIVPVGNVLVTVENICKKCYWLTSYVETILMQVWYPTTVATISREIKKLILDGLVKTGDTSLIDFKLHDFGYRGVSSYESAGIGGVAHLVNFKGTDTAAGLEFAHEFYGEPMAGFSIPAAEHSTMTAWGEENEAEAFANMLDSFPKGLVAVVSDSYNIYRACEETWGTKLKEKVLGRDGVVVVRPDSGIPHEVVLQVVTILGDKFGYAINEKGYKVLNPKIRVIQGDGVDYDEIKRILDNLIGSGWSVDNIAFGMGGGLLQKLNRDTQSFAMKCSSVIVDGKEREVFKSPVGGFKKSKKGKLRLVKDVSEGYKTLPPLEGGDDLLETVFLNGNMVSDIFENIRKRAEARVYEI